ncbi:MAG: UDPglucose 6-dehydrogenase [Parasphingorhabdus sp.]|jgi:UDPglucose 6-dehydrogenase|uniref:hypothetical protein n=1 Tax=Parasphingorhabdus sp. TaxID=2709688 RepID=UPI001B779200|nr:hypothetical protein [Parasphingorhabdus sp.]MBQ0771485.1 hypothetical protein [Sphingomonadales bacterium]|tara:strand:- start:3578 stop:3784 length:207 start_codon:yes stop_codon:yes gene_type:complete
MKSASDNDSPARIFEAVVKVNDQRTRAMDRKVIQALDRGVRGKKVALLELNFKPNIDNMRDAHSIVIA